MKKICKYKGWTICEGNERSADGINHTIYHCYNPEEMQYPSNIRSSEWDAGSLQEAKDFIDSY